MAHISSSCPATGSNKCESGNDSIAVIEISSENGSKQEKPSTNFLIIPIDCVAKGNKTEDAEKQEDVESEASDFEYDSDDDDNSSRGETGSQTDSQAEIVKPTKEANGAISDTSSNSKRRSSWRKYRGMMLAILSSFIFAVSALLVKKLETYDPFNSALYKFQGALLPAIPLILQKYYCSKKGPAVVERVWPLTEIKKLKNFGLVLLRSFLSCNALLLHFFSLKYLNMGDALTISAASPLFVSILGRIFLKEKCGYSTVIASIISLLGVVAIAKPPLLSGSESFNSDILIGSGLAFGCTIVTAISFITLRYIRKVHYSVTTLSYGAWGSFENLLILLLIPGFGLKVPSSGAEWGLVSGMAALTLFGQFAIILAMKSEQAGPVALVRTFDVLFAFLFEIAVLGTLPDTWSIIGATVIVLCVAFVGLRKWVRSFPRGHPIRSKLRFISM